MFNKKLPGVYLQKNKETANLKSEKLPTPSEVVIPLLQHIGKPCIPIVSEKQKVIIGEKIAKPNELGAPIHASVCGTVKKIEEITLPDGKMSPAIIIEADGEKKTEEQKPINISTTAEFIEAVCECGAVGLGGAGFPTHKKMSLFYKNPRSIIINCAECEPYITSDTRTLADKSTLLYKGILLLKKYLKPEDITLAVEKENETAKSILKSIADDLNFLKFKVLPSKYPQGSEKVLIYNILKKTVMENEHPTDLGVLVINSTTLIAISEYINCGKPLYEKLITVSGNAIKNPKNLIVPIGTKIEDVINFCEVDTETIEKILLGGPMMAFAAASLKMPIEKRHNALLLFDKAISKPHPTTACIRCGKCISVCPVLLDPVAISKAYEERDIDMLRRVKPNICIECGCCSYVCPTYQPLVERNKLAKALLKN